MSGAVSPMETATPSSIEVMSPERAVGSTTDHTVRHSGAASAIEASQKLGASLNIDATPSLFINGDKVDGAVPVEFVFQVIDDALRAEGVTPPPPYVAPKAEVPAAAAATPAKGTGGR